MLPRIREFCFKAVIMQFLVEKITQINQIYRAKIRVFVANFIITQLQY